MFTYEVVFDFKRKEGYWNRVNESFSCNTKDENIVIDFWVNKYININKHFVEIIYKGESST